MEPPFVPSPSSPPPIPSDPPSSSSSSSASGPSSSSLNQTSIYDVFLNFSREDVGKGFLSHLFHALKENGIDTFKDDEMLDREKAMAHQFLKAIEGSSCSVVVLSRNYAFSAWCLDELVMILDCHARIGQRVYPIYYDVDPSEVRKQRGSFGAAFTMHEERYNEPEKIHRWRSALLRAANFPGWTMYNRTEANVIKEIVTEITKFVTSRAYTIIDDDLIGFDKHLNNLNEKFCLDSKDVRFIGICGIGGIGKTALARKIYDFMSSHFERRSFLANVAEHSDKGNLVLLQKQLLSETLMNKSVSTLWNVYDGDNMIRHRLCHTKCFIVIDGVDDDDDDPLSHLAGNYDWFGPGSRIIITSRSKYLLNRCGIGANCIYEPQALNHDEALRLISLRAFRKNNPPTDLMELCKCIVEHTSGIPLALEVFGSLMNGRPSHECVLLMRNVKEMGRMIVEDIAGGHWKGRRFWRDELSRLLVPATECMLDMGLAHNDSTRKTDMEWIFTMTNFSVELSSAVFDQLASQQKPHYALIAMVMSFASVYLSVLEVVYKAGKEKIIWRSTGRIPWFYYPSPRDSVRFGSFADIVGLVCGLCQSIVVTINYFFVARQASSPIKISVWPMVFAFFVVFSKLLEARDKVRPKGGHKWPQSQGDIDCKNIFGKH